jgi:hypothetical protein
VGLFGKLFRKADSHQPDTPKSGETGNVKPPQTHVEIPRAAKIALLDKLSRNIIDEGWRSYLNTLVGSLDVALRQMEAEGLLAPASTAEKLAKLHTVPQLKEMLKGLGVKPSGKKADIINAIVAVMPESELDRLVGNVELYTISAAGKAELDAFYAETSAARSSAQEASYDLMLQGQFKEALATWRDYLGKYDPESAVRLSAENSAAPSGVAYMWDDSLYSKESGTGTPFRELRATHEAFQIADCRLQIRRPESD